MAQELIISISGMRGIIGENLSPENAAAYGCAFGGLLAERSAGSDKKLTVAIGRDSRPSGQMIFAAVAAGLCGSGIDVVDLGICSTPAVGVMLRELGCVGGVVITASHNPIPYNGIKLLLDNGIAPPKPLAQEIIDRYHTKQFKLVPSIECGHITATDKTNQVHIDKVLGIVEPAVIQAKKLKVVLDSVNGAGGPEGVQLLEQLGCEVVPMNTEATGLFAHTPEPTKDNLVDLSAKVKAVGADLGFAQDPDADRLAIVDENGRYIGEEYSLALAAAYMFGKHPGGVAAANLSTSRMIDDIAASAGGTVIRTAVGEANVAGAMIENNCLIGGEGNGGIIDLRVGPIRDSLVGMALTLQLMVDTDKTVGQLADELGGYTIYKTKCPATKQQAIDIAELAKGVFADAKVDMTDGARFDFADGWIHIRSSNTEPIMRMIMETKDPAVAENYSRQVEALRQQVLGS